jgi:putative copper export protein
VVRDTSWGLAWMLGALGLVIAAAGLLIAKRSPSGWAVAGLGAVAICFGEALTGHAGALSRRAPLAIGVDIAHVLGAGGWLGGLAAVVIAGLPSTSQLDETERRRAGQRLVRAYHKSAMQCVALVLLTAAIAAWLRLSAPSDLWTTPYGRVVLVKLFLVVGLLGFGMYHWRVVVTPDWNDDTGFRFKRSAAGELLVGALVLAATAVLIATALPTSLPS